ncbi:MAG: hypothetical protein EXQ58_00380 [Acidobacteria bacterium]|nr:hypothetical protein [Acidobacteriota bacterium]
MTSSSPPRVLREQRKASELLILENGRIRVTIWPENGAAVLGFEDVERRLDVMWKNPLVQPPRRTLLTQPIERNSDLFDVLDGSWFLSLPTGFFPTDYFGAPIGVHGEFRSLPFEAEILEESLERVRVKVVGKSIRTPFVLERIWELERDSRVLKWDETLSNRSGEARPCAWLHHPAFGGELLHGAELRVPARTIATYDFKRQVGSQIKQGFRGDWPFIPEIASGAMRDCSKVPAEGSGLDHSVQMTDLSLGWGCLWNQKLHWGFALRWDERLFPWAWSWADSGGIKDYPLWGQGHMVTLQPSTSPVGLFSELVAADQVVTIPAAGSIGTRLLCGFTDQPDAPWELV